MVVKWLAGSTGLLAGLVATGIAATPVVAAAPSTAAIVPADRVLVVKSERRLYLMRDGKVLESFRVALGRHPSGSKERQGDGRTPEGDYHLEDMNPDSRFYRSIRISYPNSSDVARARAHGVAPGGDIMIQCIPRQLLRWGADQWMFNWTEGCIAVTNDEMEVIWRSVSPGTPIEIRP
jgi:murein L,D-transpeptidase YafK